MSQACWQQTALPLSLRVCMLCPSPLHACMHPLQLAAGPHSTIEAVENRWWGRASRSTPNPAPRGHACTRAALPPRAPTWCPAVRAREVGVSAVAEPLPLVVELAGGIDEVVLGAAASGARETGEVAVWKTRAEGAGGGRARCGWECHVCCAPPAAHHGPRSRQSPGWATAAAARGGWAPIRVARTHKAGRTGRRSNRGRCGRSISAQSRGRSRHKRSSRRRRSGRGRLRARGGGRWAASGRRRGGRSWRRRSAAIAAGAWRRRVAAQGRRARCASAQAGAGRPSQAVARQPCRSWVCWGGEG